MYEKQILLNVLSIKYLLNVLKYVKNNVILIRLF